MARIDRTTNTLIGGPEPENYTDGTASFGQFCLKRLTAYADYTLLIDALTGEQITAYQVRDRSIRVARALAANDIRPGVCVGICASNRPEFVYVIIGVIMTGATLAPLNVTYTERELKHALNLSKPRLIFADPANMAKITAAAKHLALVSASNVIQFGADFEAFCRRDFVDMGKPYVSAAQQIEDVVALILCSSGTTGLPKGVQLTQRNVLIGISQFIVRPDALEAAAAPEPIMLSILPWFHAFGILSLIAFIMYGRRVVFLPKFEEPSFLNTIQKYRINTALMVPPLMVFLAKHPLVDDYDLSSLAIIWCGAAPLSAESEDAVRQRLNIGIIRQGYGMTEGTLALFGQTDELHKSGSVGAVRHGILARICDVETGVALPANCPGELCFKGSVVMKGYVGDRQATEAMLDADGFLHTGDIGYYEETGEMFIVDRLKELIKYNGFQVPPAEIEGVLLQHADVLGAGVVGVPDERAGELPLAFVVRRTGSAVTADEIQRFVAERCSPAKRLHGGIRFVDVIPKSPSGKILRRELRAMLQQTVQSKL